MEPSWLVTVKQRLNSNRILWNLPKKVLAFTIERVIVNWKTFPEMFRQKNGRFTSVWTSWMTGITQSVSDEVLQKCMQFRPLFHERRFWREDIVIEKPEMKSHMTILHAIGRYLYTILSFRIASCLYRINACAISKVSELIISKYLNEADECIMC